jgi:hypothetical protein
VRQQLGFVSKVARYSQHVRCLVLACARQGIGEDAALRHDGSPSARRRAPHGGSEMSYSLKVEDYIRLCRSCHNEYDGGTKPATAVAA